ncbi:MAG: isoleucine--tRNA ligase [Candidatus Babeliaceae bacterium]|jgi:isoleucyl-tRNA synthetase
MPDTHKEQTTISYKDTLNLPHTDFPLRPASASDDPLLLERWKSDNLYDQAMVHNQGKEKFILHDGPPYANGHIHLGHAYNKILKDITTKSRRMLGYHVPVTPGWDCHGLPIEHKVSQENPGATPYELKKKCRTYAQQWVDIQREDFKKLGVIMDWEHPYITMAPTYEAKTVEAFGVLVQKNTIERKNKTVAWCPSCATTLASAEIEYQDRKDPSLYVLFKMQEADARKLFPTIAEPLYFVVWTTTPWTLPLNRALMIKPGADYVVADMNGKHIIVAAARIDAIVQQLKTEKKVIQTFSAETLTQSHAEHPFIEKLIVPIITDDSVGLEDGTAIVHCAPGCGPIDYEVGVKHNLEIFSPVSPQGAYTHGIMPQELINMPVSDGQIWVIKKLHELGNLFYKTSINHSYPHCWRCHNGLIFRATRQWFFNLQQDNIKQKALDAVNTITFIPEHGKSFLKATLENRWEWCLSRQRSWGVPIPALLCMHCDYTYTNQDFINNVAQHIAQEGIEYWDRVTLEELAPKDLTCPTCELNEFRKETDILDVWFDSGISHYAVLYNNSAQQFPADLYLEGIDQHRGWFQSSLLTAMVLEQQPPMKTIMTHGFTVDEKGQKMSKSLGNVVAPQDIIKTLGTDGLRMWVASIGHQGDAVVSDTLIKNVGEVYRKIRNTCRAMLMNLYDYDHTQDAIAYDKLSPIDAYAVFMVEQLERTVIEQYKQNNFTGVFHELADYCTTHVSALYVEVTKDRLYCDTADSHTRRSTQTALWYMLDTLTHLVAPIMSFTAEFISDFYQKNKTSSIHLQSFAQCQLSSAIPDKQVYITTWETLLAIRSAVLKAIEPHRAQGLIKQSLEARVDISVDDSLVNYELIKNFINQLTPDQQQEFWKDFFVVSQVNLALTKNNVLSESGLAGVSINVSHAEGVKCPRCWRWEKTENAAGLCQRCAQIVEQL